MHAGILDLIYIVLPDRINPLIFIPGATILVFIVSYVGAIICLKIAPLFRKKWIQQLKG